jgi:hypothetical protein
MATEPIGKQPVDPSYRRKQTVVVSWRRHPKEPPMRKLRTLAVAAALTLPIAMPPSLVLAQDTAAPADADALTAANELFALLSDDLVGQLGAQLMAQLWPVIERDLSARGVDAAALAELRGEFERIQLLHLADVMKEGPAIYARHFTATELREIAAFYRTPTGQKTLREMPKVTAEAVAAVLPRLQEVQRATQDAFARILRERGYIK